MIIFLFSTQGSIIPVVLDITANHQGHFTFSLCPNNDIWADPDQDCFDRQVNNLRAGYTGSSVIPFLKIIATKFRVINFGEAIIFIKIL